MGKATLVVMAAGMGSRFGTGIKQLEPVGPFDEIIMDYSIYDAMEAGFDTVLFVIRKDLEKEFKERIGNRIEKKLKVEYAFQEVDNIPEIYQKRYEKRSKPWGTGQAILACKELLKTPFLVINADDYYGKEAFVKAYQYLMEEKSNSTSLPIGMVGFMLRNTLSDNGAVTRGICQVGEDSRLLEIKETYGIFKEKEQPYQLEGDKKCYLDGQSVVSMNMWALPLEFLEELEKGFDAFLAEEHNEDLTCEYLLPTIIGQMLEENRASVHVLMSSERWFGVTYKEDKDTVVEEIQKLIEKNVYPRRLWTV